MHFTYDALGPRLSKRFGAEYTQWLWDGDVPLHEWKERLPEHYDVETGESFADLDAAVASLVDATNRDFTTWLFEPDGHRPMAKLSGREQLSIITDHLGTPVAAYDGSGVQRFSRSLDIYGGELAGEGSPSIPFRYPGQYFDVETGLSYNRFRYYDPGEGVYLSVDPIGLAGGNPTLYGYVGDVNGEVDVFGLTNNPLDFLRTALNNQGINTGDPVPGNFKEKWTDVTSNVKYEVRIHPANPQYATGDIFRVARKRPGLNAQGQGLGMEYLDSNGDWHNTSKLKPGYPNGTVNPDFDVNAARDTHMNKPNTCP